MPREFRSQSELREICLDALRGREGFENVDDVLIQPRDASTGGTNWTLAGFRPRVDNAALRGARDIIGELCRSYQLRVTDAPHRSSPGE